MSEEQLPEISDTEAASLAELAAMVAEGAPAEAPPEAEGAPAVDSVAEARAILATAAPFAVGFWPWMEKVATPENQEAMAQAWGPVLDHYGVTLGGVMEHPVGAALIVSLPIVGQGFQAWREHNATIPKEAPKVVAGSPESAGQDATMLSRG